MHEMNQSAMDDDRRLDRLVDGELTRQEYAELLRSLDEHPEGWRRCAMAFLESQAWGRELNAVRQEAAAPPAVVAPASLQSQRPQQWPYYLAVAASFLVAFGLGLAARSTWSGTPGLRPLEPLATDSERLVVPGSDSDSGPGSDSSPTWPENRPMPADMRLVVEREGNSSGSFELPVHAWTPDGVRWVSGDNPNVPPEVRRALERMGSQVKWQRHVVPVQADDGRRVVVPVEHLQITPVGGQRYQ